MEIIIIITAITSTPCIRATMTISSADRLLRSRVGHFVAREIGSILWDQESEPSLRLFGMTSQRCSERQLNV